MIDKLRTYWKAGKVLADSYHQSWIETRTKLPANNPEATLIGSEAADQCGHFGTFNQNVVHFPVLDIDYNARLTPSSTLGHFHLYLDKSVTWRQYKRVLKALSEAGLIEEGYYEMALKRKQTFVRRPGVTKTNERANGRPLPSVYS